MPHGPARRPDPRPARGGPAHRRAAPGPGRRGLGQDAGHHPARGQPAPARGRGGEHPGPDVHQQGGRRDAVPGRGAGAEGGGLGRDLPQPLRPAAPVVRPAGRDRSVVHDLRPGRPAPRRQAGDGAARPRRPDDHPRAGRRRDQPRQERPGRPRGARQAGGRPRLGDHRQGLRRLPEAAPGLVGRRLRRPARPPRDHPEGAQEGPRRARRPVPLRPGRRVSGHEPGPVRDRPGALGRPPQPLRHRRPRPVDLRLAGGEPQQHPRLRGRLPRLPGRQARAATTGAPRTSSASPTT